MHSKILGKFSDKVSTINNDMVHRRTITTKSKMNQKAYSVLFCALLASTFAHELRAKGVAPVSSRLGGALDRAASTEVCELECTFTASQNFTFGISVQVIENVLVLANLSANAALLIDASSHIVVLLNGTSGAGVALNISSQTGVYLSSGLWVASKTTLDVYIKSLSGGLASLLSISGGVSFSLKFVSKIILTVINEVVANLIISIGLSIKQDITVGLSVVLTISANIIKLLNGNLSGLLALIGSEVISISLDIAALLQILVGIESVILKLTGDSLQALLESGVVLNITALLGASDGLILLADLLLAIAGSIKASSGLETLFNDTQSAWKLIAQLGGNSTVGINGLITVAANLVALIDGSVTLEVFLTILIQFVAKTSHYAKADLTAALTGSLQGLLLVTTKLNLTSKLSGLVVIIKGVIAGSWTYKNVNVGEILLKLAAGVALSGSSLLQLIVKVLVKLTAVVALKTAISALVLVLILNLNSAIGAWLLIELGINISTSLLSVVGGILKSLLSGIVKVILGLLTGNLSSGLSSISGIGSVIIAVKAAYEAEVSGGTQFDVIINSNASFKGRILALIQTISGVSLGISSSVVSSVTALLESITSVSAYIGVDVSASVSISVSS